MLNLLLIGNGKFGQNYIKTLASFSNINLKVANRNNWQELIDNKPDGVLIATPPHLHIEMALQSLKNNIPTMIEKPLALDLNECQKLNAFNQSIILVNHIHLFSKDYQYIKQNIKPYQIKHIDSIGASNNIERNYSELFDYGCHDIAMILDLMQQFPSSIKCEKFSDDRLFLIEMNFEGLKTSSVVGHIDIKRRYLKVNDQIYDGANTTDNPLTTAIQVFINAIQGKKDYRLGLNLSMKVMKVLDICQQ